MCKQTNTICKPKCISLQNKCRTADPDRQILGWSSKLSFFVIWILAKLCFGPASFRSYFGDWCIRLFALIINCTIIVKTKSRFSQNIYAISDRIWCKTNISGTQPRKNMITMGKVDTFDLMTIITWAMDVSFQSLKWKWAVMYSEIQNSVIIYPWFWCCLMRPIQDFQNS